MKGTTSLTIETHGLGEGLSNHHLEALLNKVADSISILIEAARSESLVGNIKVGEEVVLFHDLGNFVPLLRSRINTGWVVSADVQQNDGVVLGVLQVLGESLKVETLGLWIVITVVLPLLSNDFNETSV